MAEVTWAQLNPRDVSLLVTADLDANGSKDLIMNFPGFGLWSYRIGVGWSQVNTRDATRLAAGDLDGNGVSDLVIDFGAGVGVWVLKNATTWSQLNPLTSQGITTGDVDGNGHDEAIFDSARSGSGPMRTWPAGSRSTRSTPKRSSRAVFSKRRDAFAFRAVQWLPAYAGSHLSPVRLKLGVNVLRRSTSDFVYWSLWKE